MFRTALSVEKSKISISPQTKMVSMGSCFAESILGKLRSAKLNVTINPLGLAYNPISLFNLLDPDLILREGHLVSYNNQIYSLDLHSSLHGETQAELSRRFDQSQQELQKDLESTDIVILTFGTAIVQVLKDTGRVVNNCQRQPSASFSSEFLSPESIVAAFQDCKKQLQKVRPTLKFILTVSPVRHLRSTIIKNSLSKAILIQSIHDIVDLFPKDCAYFPSYEIMMDDLRDYRFYDVDMIHPNKTAVDYIFDAFGQAHFDNTLLKWLKEWGSIKKRLQHRPFHIQSKAHQKFLQVLLEDLRKHSVAFPLSQEIRIVESQMND